MNLISKSVKIKKVFIGSFYILLLTFGLLELASFFMFQPLTKEKFSYRTSEAERLLQIENLKKNLNTTQFQKNGLYQFHPYVGYINRPGAHPWPNNKTTFNDYGMASINKRNYPYKKKPDEYVVAVLGGSVAEIFANTGEKYINHFMKSLYGIKKNIILINLAAGGYKQPQQLFNLQYALLSGFEFDAVLNIDGFNDLVLASVNIDRGVNPVFPSAGHIGLMSKMQMNNGLDRQSVKFLSNYYNSLDTQLALLSFIQKSPFKYSIFFNLTGELMSKKHRAEINNLKYKWTVEASKTIAGEYRGPRYTSTRGNLDATSDIWQYASEMTFAICQANDLDYIHILQPNQYVKDSKPMSEEERGIAINSDSEWGQKAERGYSYLISKGADLKKKGISFYDFSMIFQNDKRVLYEDDCCHFNKKGNRVLAKSIAKIMKDLIP
jgi:hypothetical protein